VWTAVHSAERTGLQTDVLQLKELDVLRMLETVVLLQNPITLEAEEKYW
jgi:hypothetical protein